MKSFYLSWLILVLLISMNSFAANSSNNLTKKQSDQIAADYLKSKYDTSLQPELRGRLLGQWQCPVPDQNSCVKVLCEKTGDCNIDSAFNEIALACRGASGDCVDVLCNKTGDCNFRSNAIEIAQSCKASNGECTRVGCEKTGDCNFRANAKEIAQACTGVYDGACVSYGCDRTGDCNFRANFIKIARSCAGN